MYRLPAWISLIGVSLDRSGLSFIGTARMLLLAEQRSVIDDAEAVVRRLTAAGYRIPPRILQELRE